MFRLFYAAAGALHTHGRLMDDLVIDDVVKKLEVGNIKGANGLNGPRQRLTPARRGRTLTDVASQQSKRS